jgi:hypothetical protein
MQEPDISAITPAMVGQVYLDQLPPPTAAAIRAACTEEQREWLREREQALEERRASLEDAFERRKARLDDTLARYKEEVDSEVEDRVERGIEAARAEVLQDVEDRLQELRDTRHEARQQRDAAEHQLLALLRPLLGEKGSYLRNSNILEFDQVGVNAILRKHGWRVRSKATYSERVVKTRVEEARWQLRALFWLDAVSPEGVAEEDDESHPEHQDVVPDRLALPAGERPA